MKTAHVWKMTCLRTIMLLLLLSAVSAAEAAPDTQRLSGLLQRASDRTTAFLDQFSDVKCTESVHQEKLGKDNKVEIKQDAIYEYLVILATHGGELNLAESRTEVRESRKDRKNSSMLVSNGFATLFLVFHPSYADSFRFEWSGEEVVAGRNLAKVRFEHIPGTKSPAALALRGREYPLELTGTAWIEPQTGSIAKMDVGVADTLKDVGLKTMQSEIDFAPMSFNDAKEKYWFPVQASVEVETPRQHWRNVHQFTAYKKFSVSTEEQVSQK